MTGIILMTVLYIGIALYAISHYKDHEASLKEMLLIISSLLTVAFSLVCNVL